MSTDIHAFIVVRRKRVVGCGYRDKETPVGKREGGDERECGCGLCHFQVGPRIAIIPPARANDACARPS